MKKENNREEVMLLNQGVNTSGIIKLYKVFNKYIGMPSFNIVLKGKGKFTEFQFNRINSFLTWSEQPAQIETDIKTAITYLEGEGFKEYSWENFQKYANFTLGEEHKKKKDTKEGKDKEPPVVYTSFYKDNNYIYEQGFNKDANKCYFIKWDKQEQDWEVVDEFIVDGVTYRPIFGEELLKEAVILPREPVEYNSDEELEKEIIKHIHTWLDVSPEFEQLAYYNILLSWVYQRFNTLNYTRALGDTGTGKSRFLFTLGHLHYKPMLVAGALTPAVIFRIIDKWKGTLMIDEGDQDKSEETNTFIKIMNCGYEKGMVVSRCDKNNPNQINFFDVFCPKVLTTRRRFEDKATEARCMTTVMTQTHRLDIKENFTDAYFKVVESIRGKLLLWRLRNYDKIDPEAGLKVNLDEFEPRLRQVNRAFISLFADKPSAIEKFRQYLTIYQTNLIEERATSFDGIIVNNLAMLIGQGWDSLTCGDILEQVNSGNYNFQYPITARKIGTILRGMGLEFHPRKISGKTKKALLMDKQRLQNIFSRYVFEEATLENLSLKGYPVTEVTQLPKSLKIIAKKSFVTDEGEKGSLSRCPSNLGNFGNSVTEEIVETPKKAIIGIDDINDYLLKNPDVQIEKMKEELGVSDSIVEKIKSNGLAYEVVAGRLRRL